MTGVEPGVAIHPDEPALFDAAAQRVIALGREAIEQHGSFHLALSGGSTPRGLHLRLAERPGDLDWTRVHIWFGDERCVPPGDADSNFRMASESLLSRLPIAPERIHRIAGELPPPQAADQYAAELASMAPSDDEGRPRLDLILLGLGTDGHIASLFPGTAGMQEFERNVTAVFIPRLQRWRITLTFPVLDRAAHLMVLVAGRAKADVVRAALGRAADPLELPVRRLRPAGTLEWFLDAAAARQLTGGNGA